MMTLWFLAQGGGNPPGGGGGRGNTPNIQIIVWGLLISISIISWLVKLIAQKREEAKIRAAKKAREADLLRTGRTEDGRPAAQPIAPVAAAGPSSHDEARRRLQEIAQRRRAELEQMARQDGGGGGGSASPHPAPPPMVAAPPMSRTLQPRPLGPAGPAFPSARPRPEPQRAKAAPRQDQRKKKSQPVRPAPQPQQRPAQRVAEPQSLADMLMETPPQATGVYSVAPQTVHAAASWTPGAGSSRTAMKVTLESATTPDGIAALRKALVLAEVLAPPVSARPDAHDSTDGPLMRRAG